MNQGKWKDFFRKRSTIWSLSLCIMGVIVLGGAVALDNSRSSQEESGQETDASSLLEEALRNSGSSDNTSLTGTNAEEPDDFEEVSGTGIQDNAGSTDDSGDLISDSDSISDSAAAGSTDGSLSDSAAADNTDGSLSDSAAADNTDGSLSDSAAVSSAEVSGTTANSSGTATDGDNSDNTAEENSGTAAESDNGTSADSSAAVSGSADSASSEAITADSAAASPDNSTAGTQTGSDSGTTEDSSAEVSSFNIISEQVLLENNISFDDGEALIWPSAGTIVIDYSMDKSVYFPTLNQYKYNPALIISSETGNQVLAAAKGIVESIDVDEETGTTLTLNIGNGYRLTYGQLKEVAVSQGDIVEEGGLLAYVSEPTKYYSTEGSNLYFAMTKDGEPVDPVLYLE